MGLREWIKRASNNMIAVSCFTVEEAQRRLKALPTHDVDVALAKHPRGPVHMRIEPGRSQILYAVVVGEGADATMIWSKVVTFAGGWRNRPGGVACREASHEQDIVAWAMLTLVELRGSTPSDHLH
jgi:hypothetical protein